LKDVARIELGASSTDSSATFNGKPVLALGAYPTGDAAPAAVRRAVADSLAQLRRRLPDGLQLDMIFDFTPALEARTRENAPECLLVDVQFPDAASSERTQKELAECTRLVRQVRGVRDVLSFTENPFDTFSGHPCLLVCLARADQRTGTRHEMGWAVRAALERVPTAVFRVRELGREGHSYAYPIELVVTGPDAGKVRELTDALSARSQKTKKLTDLWVNPDTRPTSQLYLDIDRTKTASLGVGLTDLFNVVETYMGSKYVTDLNSFGRTWHVTLGFEKDPKRIDGLKELQVRTNEGKMVRLSSVLTVRTVDGAVAIERIDAYPAFRISANPVTALSVEKARALCESEFDDARRALHLPAGYRLIWLRGEN
jgi:multidrug efflux pump subunit AcrB